jgi:arylsulfatase A-like enzyme
MVWARGSQLFCRRAFCGGEGVLEALLGGVSDLAYVAALTLLGTLALRLAGPRQRAVRAIEWGFMAAAVVSIVAGFANSIALRELGHPLTYQWLYYSDFLLSLDAYNSLSALVSWSLGLRIVGGIAAVLFAAPPLGRRLARGLGDWPGRRRILPSTLLVVIAVSVTASLHPAGRSRRDKSASPVVYFLRSTMERGASTLGSVRPTVGPDDVLAVAERPRPDPGHPSRAPRSPAVTNVLVLVLESVGAESVGLYGAVPSLTPRLDGYRGRARIYARAYAHVPSTMHTLVSLLASAYHPHSFRILTREAPAVPLRSLSEALRSRGYRTAFFNGADNRFQRGSEFLRHQGIGTRIDQRDIPCPGGRLKARQKDWPLLDGVYDRCTTAALFEWIVARREMPFFAVLWTMQTHYPYFAAEERPFAPGRPRVNRYMSGLYESDQALGDLLERLDAAGVLDSTLVVVVGDHGEGLGKHWHTVHSTLYEEDVHVPLMLINRSLFHGDLDSVPVGLVDIAPTITDVLGLPPEPAWQGRSAFDPDRGGRVYLFAPFSGVMFGMVEGSRKYIYDAGANTWEVYDLTSDPAELTNLASSEGEPAEQFGRLAAWYQYQQTYYRRVMGTNAW